MWRRHMAEQRRHMQQCICTPNLHSLHSSTAKSSSATAICCQISSLCQHRELHKAMSQQVSAAVVPAGYPVLFMLKFS